MTAPTSRREWNGFGFFGLMPWVSFRSIRTTPPDHACFGLTLPSPLAMSFVQNRSFTSIIRSPRLASSAELICAFAIVSFRVRVSCPQCIMFDGETQARFDGETQAPFGASTVGLELLLALPGAEPLDPTASQEEMAPTTNTAPDGRGERY